MKTYYKIKAANLHNPILLVSDGTPSDPICEYDTIEEYIADRLKPTIRHCRN